METELEKIINCVLAIFWSVIYATSVRKWSKHKKPFISASKRPRMVLNAFLECIYMAELRI